MTKQIKTKKVRCPQCRSFIEIPEASPEVYEGMCTVCHVAEIRWQPDENTPGAKEFLARNKKSAKALR